MEVYLLRHGIAQERDAKKYPDDRLRPLTIEGTERMREIVRGMLKLGVEFDAVFDSGFTRARQTTEIVTDAYRIDNADITTTPALEPDRDAAEVFALLESHKAARRVLLVGHEPQLSLVLAYLSGGRDGDAFDFKKGALARVDLSALKPRSGMLVYLLPPKVLRKIR
ncbi:MAG: phosphohistidine phosphatase SixA [Candidatus Eremiobacteraeota bacterium]|nr:phosphohistidine phosphatase SixA [Candidatus Eremiobacteraeota bacterium]MBV8667960.1 phosphohistidine phosphatase SixA [Candidatus Eremiobacteraeota bacterium]